MNVRRLAPIIALALALLGVVPASASTQVAPTTTADFRQSPEQARTDRERLWTNGCLAFEHTTTPPSCVFGKTNSSFTLALVGDSHLSHLFPGFEKLAKQRGWRLVTFLKVNCEFLDIAIYNNALGRAYTECAAWNTKVVARLKAIKPDLTVTLAFRWIHPMDSSQDTSYREGAAIGRMLKKVPGDRAIIVDTPYSLRNIPTCLEKHPHKPSECAIPASQVLQTGVRTREHAAADVGGATYLDLTDRICAGFPCRVVTNDIIMFRDAHHLTATYAATLSGALGNALDRAID